MDSGGVATFGGCYGRPLKFFTPVVLRHLANKLNLNGCSREITGMEKLYTTNTRPCRLGLRWA